VGHRFFVCSFSFVAATRAGASSQAASGDGLEYAGHLRAALTGLHVGAALFCLGFG